MTGNKFLLTILNLVQFRLLSSRYFIFPLFLFVQKLTLFGNYNQGAFLERVSSANPGVPCFLFGHSTGGAVVLKVTFFSQCYFIPVCSFFFYVYIKLLDT
jgi:hypothetical protein